MHDALNFGKHIVCKCCFVLIWAFMVLYFYACMRQQESGSDKRKSNDVASVTVTAYGCT